MDLENAGTSNGILPTRKLKKRSKELIKRDLASLPRSVLQRIFSYLDIKSIQNCAVLCSTFYNLSKDSLLYKTLKINCTMSRKSLEYNISKISHPRFLIIEYKANDINPSYFNNSVLKVLRKCGENILRLQIEYCDNEEVLMSIAECVNLENIELYRCKSTFGSLLSLCTLVSIKFHYCHFPPKIVKEIVKNNVDLQNLLLVDNVNVNPNEICELISHQPYNIKEIHLSERRRLIARSIKMLGRLNNLRKLVLICQSGFELNPQDCLEYLAAGCPHLEKMHIDNWAEVTDRFFIPAIPMLTQLKKLVLKQMGITIKSIKEAVIMLPMLKTIVISKCRIKQSQLITLGRDFEDINIKFE